MFQFKRAEAPLIKMPAAAAAEVLKKFKPEPAAQALPAAGQTPAEFLQALEKNPLSGEAVRFLAHGLPEREAVWWACQSARAVEISLNQADKSALAAAEKWVKAPSPGNRAEAGAAAAKTDMTGPGGWAAQAAAWSQLPAPDKPAAAKSEEPADSIAGLTAPAVAGAILLAAGRMGKAAMPEIKSPELKAPAVTTPKIPSVNAGLPGMPAVPGSVTAIPAISGPAMPSLAMPGKPALPAPQAPALSLSVPTISVPQMPAQVAAPQVPGIPQIQAPGLNLSAPTLPGMPSAPAMAKPEIPPVDQKKLAKMLKPFLELGRDVASGKNVWA